ncbi:hypothetical protein ACLB9X_07220 [Streptomyces sp. 5K101]|uniref:hypothetical protein n=1 Tax=Streptomyces sp. 5K101 TaxID=3390037 RepID=UPI0039769C07
MSTARARAAVTGPAWSGRRTAAQAAATRLTDRATFLAAGKRYAQAQDDFLEATGLRG